VFDEPTHSACPFAVAILKELDHPNIVKAFETFDYKNRLFLVLELCSGGDLYQRDPYTESQAARITKSLLSAVSYLHEHQIVHRDLVRNEKRPV
jgi:calcium-dependent protein kinase